MPNLNEYLGGIVSSITSARAICDLQTVGLAKEYAEHSLLKHFSVPRMRIEDVEMTIPIAIDNIEYMAKDKYTELDNRKHNAIIYRKLLESSGMPRFNEEFSKELMASIAKSTSELDQKWRIEKDSESIKKVSENLVLLFLGLIKKYTLKTKKIDEKLLREEIAALLSTENTASDAATIGNLNIIIEASKLRELKPESLIYIKMKIREDGMEWAVSENNKGEIESRLLPE